MNPESERADNTNSISNPSDEKSGHGVDAEITKAGNPSAENAPSGAIDISIIVVNYNVKEFAANLLSSLEKARNGFRLEIFVVDNASSDGSISYLKRRYPDVTYIENRENTGFGKANNQAIRQAKGKYTLLINPDTIVRQDTLEVMYGHMENHPETAAAGCKMLNPDGTFAPESRRAVPTPMTALWKILGLPRLFPSSKRFSAYYLGGEDENKQDRVPVLSGAFMFFRTEVLRDTGGFDEQFFMYGEDIDLCYRIRQKGWEIDYVPLTSIIHYKGESTKKENLDYVVTFNKAMYLFFRKHYSFGYTLFFRIFILTGIIMKGVISYMSTIFRKLAQPITDLAVLNILVVIFFIWRYNIDPGNILNQYHVQYLFVNLLLSVIFIGSAVYYDLYGKNRLSIPATIKSTIIAFAGVVVITFFLRDFAFSRLILLLSSIAGVLILSMIRLIQINRSRKAPNIPGSFLERKVILVGLNDKTAQLIRKIRSRADWKYNLVGVVAQDPEYPVDEVENVPVIGDRRSILQLVRYHEADEIIFILPAVDHDQILRIISELRDTTVYPRIVPDSLDYIVGKTNVDYLDDIPVMDVNLPYFSRWNLFLKRMLDLSISLFLLIILTPLFAIPTLLGWKHRKLLNIHLSDTRLYSIPLMLPYAKHRWRNRYLLLWQVLRGKMSLVGSPIIPDRKPRFANVKPGLTGFRQLSENRLYHEDEKQLHELYYLQNYSVWMDLDVLAKTLIYRRRTLENIDQSG
jgi:O-antigen biosynthesis protein